MCSILSFVDEHLRDELLNPEGVLLPQSEWPSETPRSKVCCDDSQWYAICKAGGKEYVYRSVGKRNLQESAW